MKPYAIDLPNHVLRFSLPEEIVRGDLPVTLVQRFEPRDASFVKNGFYEMFAMLYDIKGPFWVGAYGSLKIHLMVQKKLPEYESETATIEKLERYVHWKISRGNDAQGCVISRSSLNGAPSVRRQWNTFGDPRKREPEDLEIFSLPLNDELFLDVGFNVKAWEGGRGKEGKWKAKAEALREAIKATIVLEPKPVR